MLNCPISWDQEHFSPGWSYPSFSAYQSARLIIQMRSVPPITQPLAGVDRKFVVNQGGMS